MYFIKYRERVGNKKYSRWTFCWMVGLNSISENFPYPEFQTNILKYRGE